MGMSFTDLENFRKPLFFIVVLMAVIGIIGIIAAIAIPKFVDATIKSKVAELPTVVMTYEHAQLAYLAEKSYLAGTRDSLIMDTSVYNGSNFKGPLFF
jgi:type II secretory pathway pseudopilin PulG